MPTAADVDLIIGVDPGKITGVAVYEVMTLSFTQQWDAPAAQFVDWAWAALDRPVRILVACERFDITPMTGKLGRTAENWSIEQIGVLRHLCRRNRQTFVLQDRSSPQRMAPNAALRSQGWYKLGRSGKQHAPDATRQVVLALARQFNQPPPWVS